MHRGHCLCGGIEFEIDGELAPIEVCYCTQCQKAQGTALATNFPVATLAFRFVKGESLLKAYESSKGKERCFCSRCGSPIFSRLQSLPGIVRIRAGLLDGDVPTKPIAHFHVASKPAWWSIDDRLPQYQAGRTSTPPQTTN